MNEFETAKEVTACIFMGFMVALQNARLTVDQITTIMEDATLISKAILESPEIPVSPQVRS